MDFFFYRISDISNLLGQDWVKLARTLDIDDQDINLIISEYPDNVGQQAMVMLRLWLNTEGNKATGNALEIALKNCDREDIVDKCMFNVKMVTDDNEQEEAHNTLKMYNEFEAFNEENNVNSKSLTRDYSIDVNVDENDYKENSFNNGSRLGGIREEMASSHSQFARQEESTSDYEREEQKYVAEEKEFASSYQQESMLETRESDNMIITEKSETKSDYLHEEMKKMSVEESKTTSYTDGEKLVQMTSESRLEEQHQQKEMFSQETSELRQTQLDDREDGAVLILSDSRKESRQEFSAETHETKQYEEASVVKGMRDIDLDTFPEAS